MSDLLAFDDDDSNLFVPEDHSKSKKSGRNLDDLFGSSDNSANPSTTLDDIFTAQPGDDIFQPQAKTQQKASGSKTNSTKIDTLFGADDDGDEFDFFSSPAKPATSGGAALKSDDTKPLDSLDFLLDSASQSDSRTTSHGVSHDVSDDSLDMLLDAQPTGTVSASDDLLSIMDPYAKSPSSTAPNVANEKQVVSKAKPTETAQNLFDIDDQSDSTEKSGDLPQDDGPQHSLDLLLNSQPTGTIPDSDNLMSIMDLQDQESLSSPSIFQQDDSLSSLSIGKQEETATQKDIDQSKPIEKSHDSVFDAGPSVSQSEAKKQSRDESMDSLDMLLDAQPTGTVPASDDLLSIVDPFTSNNTVISSNTHTTVAWERSKDSPGDTSDPVDDFSGTSPPADSSLGEITPEAPAVTTPTEPKTNLKKRSMERSFEDLLTGLSDESEPELDDMIDDSNDNTNLEGRRSQKSLLVTPNRSVTQSASKTYDHSTPYASTNAPKDSLLDDYDFGSLKSVEPASRTTRDAPTFSLDKHSEDMDAPKDSLLDDYDFGSLQPRAPEVKVHKPYNDEKTDSLDMKSWEMVDQDEITSRRVVDDDGDGNDDDELVMRHRNGSHSEDIDLSAIQDTNHLDVDLNKHKSELGKKGSLALRRKPSRKSRKSLLSGGEDAIFQDSSDPKPSGMLNGADDEGSDGEIGDRDDLSPPAKKHSPATMVPLPGFPTRPPPRLSASSPQDEDMEPPQEARRISKPPPGAFRLPPMMPKAASSPQGEFEKPALRATKRPDESRGQESEGPVGFGTPVLRKVGGGEGEGWRRQGSEEREGMFEKPCLKSTPKSGLERAGEEKMDTNTGVFTKPQLRATSNPPEERITKPVEDKPVESYEPRLLRSTPKRDIADTRTDSDKHVFGKPTLRTTGRTLTADDKQSSENSDSSAKTFEKPVLRSAKKDFRSDSVESNESPSYTFEKPTLKNTQNRPSVTNENTKKEQFTTGVFEKPSLKKTTPSPEKEVRQFGEPKGTFDKPSLRKTEGSKVAEQRSKSGEKPSWLQTAAEKQTKVLGALHTKENHSVSSERESPSWLDSPAVRKPPSGLPLQENGSHRTENSNLDNISRTPRSRESSQSSETELYTKKSSTETHNNYAPAWLRQGRSPSTGQVTGMTALSPAKSCPTLADGEVPQWKRELAKRRSIKKDSPSSEDPDELDEEEVMELPKKEDSKEPEWKRNIQLRKVQPRESPSKENQSSEPEWMKKAEEKRARLRSKSMQYSHLKLT